MNIGADLIKGPKRLKLAEAADDINNATANLVDTLAELDDAESTEDRSDARDGVADALAELLAELSTFQQLAAQFDLDKD